MLNYLLFTIIGLAGIVVASDIVVAAAQRIARKLRVSEFFIGLTITAIGTSLPEIFTNITAAYNLRLGVPASDIAIGNIVGSNIVNTTLILGIAGLFGTLLIRRKALIRDGTAMILTTILFIFMSMDNKISSVEGMILVMLFFGYTLFVMQREKIKGGYTPEKSNMLVNILSLCLGLAAIVYFADIMVLSGVKLAETMGVSAFLIGIFVGLGTSMPELSVSIMAVLKKDAELSIGNLIGSNIVNIFIAIGAATLISDFFVSNNVIWFDMVVMLIAAVLPVLLLLKRKGLSRAGSITLIIFYLLYIYLKVMFGF